MKVMVSKVMAKTLQEHIKQYTIRYKEVSTDYYKLYVDTDVFSHDNDFNCNTGKMKVIEVIYPSEFFAIERYITTNDLNRIFNNAKGAMLEDFVKSFMNEYEI